MGFLKRYLRKSHPDFYRRFEMFKHSHQYQMFAGGWADPPQYNQDGLMTAHNADFMKDERFMRAYNLGQATGSRLNSQIHYRAYVVCWAANRAKKLEGDFVECGVNKGALARMIIDYIDFDKTEKTFYLLDTYEGWDQSLLSDFEKKKIAASSAVMERYPPCYEEVKKIFAPFKNIELVKGSVPGTLSQVPSEKIAFLSLDMNCAAPEEAAAEFFWPKMVPGGVIVLDDYAWLHHHEQKQAMDRFAKRNGTEVLTLPTGQGLIIK
jgi:hypothetical protein